MDANVEFTLGEVNRVHYEGQHITALDTIAGQAKNAVVEGQTLVNYLLPINKINWSANSTHNGEVKDNQIIMRKVNGNPNSDVRAEKMNILLQPNTSYLLIYEVIENIGGVSGVNMNDWSSSNSWRLTELNVGVHKIKITTKSEVGKGHFQFYGCSSTENNAQIIFSNLVLIPYQEGMENWDIPYFEGMTSCKMPILHTVGKNLFDGVSYIDGFIANGNDYTVSYDTDVVSILVNVNKNTDYTLSAKTSFNRSIIGGSVQPITIGTKTTKIEPSLISSNTLKFNSGDYTNLIIYLNNTKIDIEELQLEEGSAATPFEPPKSNILTTPEDLELRGIGNVKDELNVETGELTQRVGEIVLDGSEEWSYIVAEPSYFQVNIENAIQQAINPATVFVACDKYVARTQNEIVNLKLDGVSVQWTQNRIVLRDSSITNLNDMKAKLAQNPITVQYVLATPTIKTVDLSDNHVYSYQETTHYDCSSAEGSLVPTLSVKVPTDVQATIAQQRETIQTLNSENERLNQIQEALKASMLDSQVQLMNLSWNTDFEVFTLRESIAPKDFLLASRTGSNIDKFSQAKFIIENDCPDLEKLNSQIEYYFSKDVFSQEQFEELTDLISIVKGENGCEY